MERGEVKGREQAGEEDGGGRERGNGDGRGRKGDVGPIWWKGRGGKKKGERGQGIW